MTAQLQNIIDQINAINATGYTIDTTYADTAIKLNSVQVTQTNKDEILAIIGKYTGHLVVYDGTVIQFVDKLTGGATYTPDEFRVSKESGSFSGTIVNSYKAEWTEKDFDELERTLKEIKKSHQVDTGVSCGVEETVQLFSQGVVNNSGVLAYDQANIEYVLGRHKSLFEKEPVELYIDDLDDVADGSLVTFDNDYASGSFVMDNIEYMPDDTIKISGKGGITFK